MQRKLISLRKILHFLVILSVVGMSYTIFYLRGKDDKTLNVCNNQLSSSSNCNNSATKFKKKRLTQHNFTVQKRILIFRRAGRHQLGHDIVELVESVRFKYYVQYDHVANLPALVENNEGRFAVIIFEVLDMYLNLNPRNREKIDKYCLKFYVGLIYFLHPSKSVRVFENIGTFPLQSANGFKIKNYEINPRSTLLRITRAGPVLKKCFHREWGAFKFHHRTYEPVSYALEASDEAGPKCGHKADQSIESLKQVRTDADRLKLSTNHEQCILKWTQATWRLIKNPPKNKTKPQDKLTAVVYDKGDFDGIQRVFFGTGLQFWLHKYVQIDIDDIFVAPTGHRMNADDVMALIAFQEKLRTVIPGFSFQLGFSGLFRFRGTSKETQGDRLFLILNDRFSWFPHMWSHIQAPFFTNVTELCEYMKINRKFALRWHLNTSSHYVVAPHHAGVYPIHEPLYECWGKIWNITTTSTEHYPHLNPAHKRRGFIYNGIKVLPRQTCGLFTHTIFLRLYPGGPSALHAEIYGGPLFLSFLYNQFNIFMTHLSNYGNDRLAIYTFERVIKFVRTYTNLHLLFVEPEQMADMYFKLYPEERRPAWLVKKHFKMSTQFVDHPTTNLDNSTT